MRRNLVVTGAVLGVGFMLGAAGLMPLPDVSIAWRVPAVESSQYAPASSAEPGEEVLLVYLGSSSCYWSNAPGFPSLVRKLKVDYQRRVHSSGAAFAAVGIARDRNAATGMKHLRKFGAFDEAITGHGWFNEGVRRYVYEDLPGPAGTPQIIVVRRTLEVEGDQRSIANERVLARKVGLTEIEEWVEAGAPVPRTAAHRDP